MRNMNPDELKKLYKEINEAVDDWTRKMFMQGIWQKPASGGNVSRSNWSTSVTSQISPTDNQARGMYEYQEPEQDEQGTMYGYKVLHREGFGGFTSPRFHAFWHNGELTADRVPSENSMHGIHHTKRRNHSELGQYTWSNDAILVRCALSGTIVETEQGFRAEHAQIIEVYENGNWTSYQDYQGRASTDPHTNPFENDEEEIRWEYRFTYGKPPKGTWKAYYDFGTDS